MIVIKKKPFYKSGRFRLIFFGVVVASIIFYAAASVFFALYYTSVFDRSLGSKTPATYGLAYDEVSFPSATDARQTLRGWWIPNRMSKKAIILVHEQNQTRAHLLPLSKPLWDKGYNVLLFDLSGHGQSEGDYQTFGLREQWDVVGAANFVKDLGFKPTSIGAIGWSMGAPTAIMGMSQTYNINAVVSDSGYANLRPLHHREFFYPGILIASRLLRGYDPEQVQPGQAIRNLGIRHVFIIHGEQDDTIPISEAYTLKELGGSNVTDMWIIPDGRHVNAFETRPVEYLRRITAFFERELN